MDILFKFLDVIDGVIEYFFPVRRSDSEFGCSFWLLYVGICDNMDI